MKNRGFTLIETLVAITLLTIAITAPITLTGRSLAAAFYARDQVTAFHLAQEAIETVRHIRDRNALLTAHGIPTNIMSGIPSNGTFIIDTLTDEIWRESELDCDIPYLKATEDGSFYGHGNDPCDEEESGWAPTRFKREVEARWVRQPEELNLKVTVTWTVGSFQNRSFSISTNLYRWVNDVDDTP